MKNEPHDTDIDIEGKNLPTAPALITGAMIDLFFDSIPPVIPGTDSFRITIS